jgi:HEAT repeat protein
MNLIRLIVVIALVPSVAGASYVTETVAQMPAANPAAEAALAARIMQGGVPAVREVCGLLVPLGTTGKDDTAARYAVTALSRFAGGRGGEEARAALVKGLAESLSGQADWEIRSFLVERLAEVGRDDAVPALAGLLGDEKVAGHAAAALEAIGTPAAGQALLRGLPTATADAKAGVVKALGSLRVAGAADAIRPHVTGEDKPLRMTALWALANVGDAGVAEALTVALENTKEAYERSRLQAWSLLLAQRLAVAGKADAAVQLARRFAADAQTASNVRGAAARLLVEIQGTAALAEVLTFADAGDREMRAAILHAVARLPDKNVTLVLVDRMKSATQPEVKIAYLNALAARKDAAARDAVVAATQDTGAAVRVAALTTLLSLGQEQAIPTLIDRVQSDEPAVAKPAAEMLARIPGERPLASAAGALPKLPEKAKVALIELLASRAARGQKAAVLEQASDGNAGVRLAALRAMEKLAGQDDAPALIALAVKATDAGEESAAIRAAVAAASQSPNADQRVEPFLSAMTDAKAEKRAAIARGLAKLGGKRALDAVLADLRSKESAALRDGALRALAEWADGAAVTPLLDVAKQEKDADRRITAVRGVAQVLKVATTMPPTEKASAYAQALAAAPRPDERKMLLGGLATERGELFFDAAATTLDDPQVKAESALAVIRIALPPAKGQTGGLAGEKVATALRKALPNCPDANLKGEGQKYLATLEK